MEIIAIKLRGYGKNMTINEASKRYNIPIHILKLYESWEWCRGSVKAEYEDEGLDIDRLGMMVTLYNIGFNENDIEQYMKLYVMGSSTANERSLILSARRKIILDSIHLLEKQLEDLDYLRYETGKAE